MNDLSRAELLDHELAEAMDKLVIVKSAIYTSGERDPREPPPRQVSPFFPLIDMHMTSWRRVLETREA